MAGQPSATVVACVDQTRAQSLQRLFMSDTLRVYTNPDVVSCEIGGAVKNVLATAIGCADGLGYGWNTKAALITRGPAELACLGVEMPIAATVASLLHGELSPSEAVVQLMHRPPKRELEDLAGH